MSNTNTETNRTIRAIKNWGMGHDFQVTRPLSDPYVAGDDARCRVATALCFEVDDRVKHFIAEQAEEWLRDPKLSAALHADDGDALIERWIERIRGVIRTQEAADLSAFAG